MAQTYIVQIGNSDDKLSQAEWYRFCIDTDALIKEFADEVHFSGGSDNRAPWQNAAWVFVMDNATDFYHLLCGLCEQYRQDSIAVTVGGTFFVNRKWLGIVR
jgi:hypothetical protein